MRTSNLAPREGSFDCGGGGYVGSGAFSQTKLVPNKESVRRDPYNFERAPNSLSANLSRLPKSQINEAMHLSISCIHLNGIRILTMMYGIFLNQMKGHPTLIPKPKSLNPKP